MPSCNIFYIILFTVSILLQPQLQMQKLFYYSSDGTAITTITTTRRFPRLKENLGHICTAQTQRMTGWGVASVTVHWHWEYTTLLLGSVLSIQHTCHRGTPFLLLPILTHHLLLYNHLSLEWDGRMYYWAWEWSVVFRWLRNEMSGKPIFHKGAGSLAASVESHFWPA